MAKGRKPKQESEISTKERMTLFAEIETIYKLDYITKVLFINDGKKVSRTDLVNEALAEYVAKWEKKNGPIPVK